MVLSCNIKMWLASGGGPLWWTGARMTVGRLAEDEKRSSKLSGVAGCLSEKMAIGDALNILHLVEKKTLIGTIWG